MFSGVQKSVAFLFRVFCSVFTSCLRATHANKLTESCVPRSSVAVLDFITSQQPLLHIFALKCAMRDCFCYHLTSLWPVACSPIENVNLHSEGDRVLLLKLLKHNKIIKAALFIHAVQQEAPPLIVLDARGWQWPVLKGFYLCCRLAIPWDFTLNFNLPNSGTNGIWFWETMSVQVLKHPFITVCE